jgi:hypothetical protein
MTRIIKRLARKIVFIIVPLGLLTTACDRSDRLQEVEQFSTLSHQIQESSKNIINDIDDSCVRNLAIESRKLSLVEEPVVNSEGKLIFPPISAREQCQKWLPVVNSTDRINSLLLNYLESLGNLASQKTVNFSGSFQTLSDSLAGFGDALNTAGFTNISIGEKQRQAGLRLVDSLFSIWANQFRYKNLKPAIVCTDPYVQESVSLLQEILIKIYLQDRLSVEEANLNLLYNLSYRQAFKVFEQDKNSEQLRTTIAGLENSYNPQIQQLDRQKELTITYLKILEVTKEFHRTLAKNFQGNTSDEAIAVSCQSYFARNLTPTPASDSPRSQLLNEPTIKQLQQADRSLKDYQQKIQPLLTKINSY